MHPVCRLRRGLVPVLTHWLGSLCQRQPRGPCPRPLLLLHPAATGPCQNPRWQPRLRSPCLLQDRGQHDRGPSNRGPREGQGSRGPPSGGRGGGSFPTGFSGRGGGRDGAWGNQGRGQGRDWQGARKPLLHTLWAAVHALGCLQLGRLVPAHELVMRQADCAARWKQIVAETSGAWLRREQGAQQARERLQRPAQGPRAQEPPQVREL